MSRVKRQLELMILKLKYELHPPLKGRELDVHIMMHGRNPIHEVNHIQQKVSTMLGVHISLSLNIKAGSNELKKHSLTKKHINKMKNQFFHLPHSLL